MPRRVGIGPHREPHVVRVFGEAREHLLPVHHVVVAVAHRARLQGGEVGPGAGFGVADREVKLAADDGWEHLRLLLLGAVLDEGGADRAQREERDREARPLHLVEEEELLDGRTVLPAERLGPTDAEPAVLAHLAERSGVERATALGATDLVEELVADDLGKVRAELLLESFLLGGEIDVHARSSVLWSLGKLE